MSWTREDIDKLARFDAAAYLTWLRSGLLDWDNPSETWRAFAPVQDRFTTRDDPEPQIAEMFEVLTENEKHIFLMR